MSTLAVNTITDATGGNTATINSMTPTASSLQGFRNRIINGDMRIDQRNAGASVTPTDAFTLDRWISNTSSVSGKYSVQQNAGAVTPPSGFKNYLGVTSLSAYTVGAAEFFLQSQYIEGFNTADLAWGTASAATVTLSFWVRSSLTGTFGGALNNNAGNRSYPFTYTISAANTWEYKTVVIPGDTTGTWTTDNTRGISLRFGLGVGSTYSGTAGAWSGSTFYSATGATSVVGTNGATFYITGVQLEAGSVATNFERRPYGTELALCQRYAYVIQGNSTAVYSRCGVGFCWSSGAVDIYCNFPVAMRSAPSLTTTGTASNYAIYSGAGSVTALSTVPTLNSNATNVNTGGMTWISSGFTAGQGAVAVINNSSTAYLWFTAEL